MKTQTTLEWNGKLVKLPTMKKGQRYTGPEYSGCCNTGKRPQIIYCKHTGNWIVGTELDVEALRFDTVALPGVRVHKQGAATVWSFTTRAPAVAKFSELCRVVTEYNERIRGAMKRDEAAAQRGDIGAAMRLGEY